MIEVKISNTLKNDMKNMNIRNRRVKIVKRTLIKNGFRILPWFDPVTHDKRAYLDIPVKLNNTVFDIEVKSSSSKIQHYNYNAALLSEEWGRVPRLARVWGSMDDDVWRIRFRPLCERGMAKARDRARARQ